MISPSALPALSEMSPAASRAARGRLASMLARTFFQMSAGISCLASARVAAR